MIIQLLWVKKQKNCISPLIIHLKNHQIQDFLLLFIKINRPGESGVKRINGLSKNGNNIRKFYAFGQKKKLKTFFFAAKWSVQFFEFLFLCIWWHLYFLNEQFSCQNVREKRFYGPDGRFHGHTINKLLFHPAYSLVNSRFMWPILLSKIWLLLNLAKRAVIDAIPFLAWSGLYY